MKAHTIPEQLKQYSRETFGGFSFRGRPLGCHTALLIMALMLLGILHAIVWILLGATDLLRLMPAVNTVAAGLYSLMLSALAVCLGVYLWLKAKPLAVLAALAALTLWGLPLLNATPSRVLTASLWLLVAAAVVLGGLYAASSFLLPLSDRRDRRKVFGFLWDYLSRSNRPGQTVSDAPGTRGEVQDLVAGDRLSQFARGQGFVLTSCEHVVAISDGLKFKEVSDPGVTFTGFGDQAVESMDLCPQLRGFTVIATTEDGIEVRVQAFLPFRIDAGRRQPQLGEHLPFTKTAVFKAIYAQRVEHEGGGGIPRETKPCRWDRLPALIGERILRDIISEYTFDGLYGPYQTDGCVPRKAVAKRFCNELRAQLKPLGIQMIGGGIGNLEPADAHVYVERARNWRSEWQRRIMLKQAEGHAEWLRLVESARAEAQTDLVMDLGRQLETLSTPRTEIPPEKILTLLLRSLENLAMQPRMRHLLPSKTKRAMKDIRGVIEE